MLLHSQGACRLITSREGWHARFQMRALLAAMRFPLFLSAHFETARPLRACARCWLIFGHAQLKSAEPRTILLGREMEVLASPTFIFLISMIHFAAAPRARGTHFAFYAGAAPGIYLMAAERDARQAFALCRRLKRSGHELSGHVGIKLVCISRVLFAIIFIQYAGAKHAAAVKIFFARQPLSPQKF